MTAPQPNVVRAPEYGRGVLPALLFAVLLYSLMQTLLVPALPELISGLGIDPASGGWVLTSYLLSGAIAAPILGALGDSYGHRRLLIISMSLFLLGGVLCVVGGSYSLFLLGRVLQGASTASFPLALAIVRRHLPGDKQARAIGWLSGTLGLGAGAALVIGGFITELLSWQWLFVVGAVLGALSIVLVVTQLPRSSRPVSEAAGLDFFGAGLLAIGLLALLLAVTQGASWGWGSAGVLALALLAVVSLGALWFVEKRVQHPLVDVRVLARPTLAAVNLLTLMLGFIPYVFYVGLPVIFQASAPAGFGLDVAQTGFAMLPAAILVFFGGRLAPVMLTRMSPAVVAVIALSVMVCGSLGSALMPWSMWALVLFFSLIGLGNGLGFALAADMVSRLVPREEIAAAVGVNGVLRTVGSAFGAPVTMMILASGTQVSVFVTLFIVSTIVSAVGLILGSTIRAPR